MEKIVFWLAKISIAFLDLFDPHGFEFYLFKKDWHDYLLLRITAPLIVVNSNRIASEDGNAFILNMSFDTSILIAKTDIIKNFQLKILGFGIQVIRQQGY